MTKTVIFSVVQYDWRKINDWKRKENDSIIDSGFWFDGRNFKFITYYKKTGKKAECKQIAKIIDEQFLRLGFDRTMLEPIDNFNDTTIYRMVGRYVAVVSKEEVIYRR